MGLSLGLCVAKMKRKITGLVAWGGGRGICKNDGGGRGLLFDYWLGVTTSSRKEKKEKRKIERERERKEYNRRNQTNKEVFCFNVDLSLQSFVLKNNPYDFFSYSPCVWPLGRLQNGWLDKVEWKEWRVIERQVNR